MGSTTGLGFTESGFERKLAELNSSQQSIQGLSSWLLHHRKHHSTIVKIWYKEFLKAQDHRKLTFVYLANDVIQNSRKKSAEFGKTFTTIFKKAFEQMARISGEKTKKSLLRILAIWEERGIYEPKLINDFVQSYTKAWDDLHGGEGYEDEFEALQREVTTPTDTNLTKDQNDDRRKMNSTISGETCNVRPERKRKVRSKKEEIESALRKRSLEATNTIAEWETDGVVQLEVKLSPSPFTEPPTEDELVRMIKDLEKMPSTDAATRGKIASLPQEVSDVAAVDEICIDSDISRALQVKVEAAATLLHDYNIKLDAELEDRKTASMKLQDFLYSQKDLLTQAEHRLEEHQNHSRVLMKKLEELKSHVLSMPDLSKLPSVTDGLAPLPSAGDLFNL